MSGGCDNAYGTLAPDAVTTKLVAAEAQVASLTDEKRALEERLEAQKVINEHNLQHVRLANSELTQYAAKLNQQQTIIEYLERKLGLMGG